MSMQQVRNTDQGIRPSTSIVSLRRLFPTTRYLDAACSGVGDIWVHVVSHTGQAQLEALVYTTWPTKR